MAACAISSITSSAWCARRCVEREVLLERRRRTSSGRCASSCRITAACGPAWLLRLGLFLYDHLGGRALLPPHPHARSRAPIRPARPLKPALHARLRVFRLLGRRCPPRRAQRPAMPPNAAPTSARAPAAVARRARTATPGGSTLRDAAIGAQREIAARALVNAGGPWVGEVTADGRPSRRAGAIRLVKGSHIVVRRLFDHDRAYIFQNADGRIFFAHSLRRGLHADRHHRRGFRRRSRAVRAIAGRDRTISARAVSEYFAQPVSAADVVWTYAGVRPLYDDGASLGAGGDARLRPRARWRERRGAGC